MVYLMFLFTPWVSPCRKEFLCKVCRAYFQFMNSEVCEETYTCRVPVVNTKLSEWAIVIFCCTADTRIAVWTDYQNIIVMPFIYRVCKIFKVIIPYVIWCVTNGGISRDKEYSNISFVFIFDTKSDGNDPSTITNMFFIAGSFPRRDTWFKTIATPCDPRLHVSSVFSSPFVSALSS